jgi:hypothetical protein
MIWYCRMVNVKQVLDHELVAIGSHREEPFLISDAMATLRSLILVPPVLVDSAD